MPTGMYKHKTVPLAQRFWAKVNKQGRLMSGMKTRCWEWTASLDGWGYGHIKVAGSIKSAHRVAWFLATGVWPKPHVLHRCDNPKCVRKSHLWLGTNADNVRDMIAKGRNYRPSPSLTLGERNPSAKLTRAKVNAIRSNYTGAYGEQARIAREFNVSTSQVSRIIGDQTWATEAFQ